MVIVRFVVLLFLAAYSYSMAQEPSLNSFGKVVASLVIVFVPFLYLQPTYEAWSRKHENLASLGMLNLFLGWTLIGWVFAMVWALRKPPTVRTLAPDPIESSAPLASSKRETKLCPFCAEEVMAAAIKCKHCSSDLPRA